MVRRIADGGPARTSLWRNADFVKLTVRGDRQCLWYVDGQFRPPADRARRVRLPVSAGLVSGFAVAGSVSITLFAGALVDRWPRRPVMLISTGLRVLAWASIPIAALEGQLGLIQLIVVGFVSAGAGAFFGSAESAAVKAIVSTRQLPAALSVNEGRQAAAGLAGGPVAGLLWTVSQVLPFWGNTVSFLASMLGVALVRRPLGRPAEVKQLHLLATIREGLGFVWRRPIRYTYLVASLVNFAAECWAWELHHRDHPGRVSRKSQQCRCFVDAGTDAVVVGRCRGPAGVSRAIAHAGDRVGLILISAFVLTLSSDIRQIPHAAHVEAE